MGQAKEQITIESSKLNSDLYRYIYIESFVVRQPLLNVRLTVRIPILTLLLSPITNVMYQQASHKKPYYGLSKTSHI